ncbi:neuropeptide Y receptor [Desmophyllum pertusum]|uniref:Neuropeptide Y receptor n=1 Tax=Desmophyllum pertusum TaxID=174260 RepID=A0A9W9YN94_9CNID|nr:neuropeptide Y receptor [Desmophyllum pertusum]
MESNISTTNNNSQFFTPASEVNASEATSGETPAFKAIKLSLYAIIFLISVIGNSLVCVVIARRRRMRTVTNFFVLNLAASDLAITCICIPFDIPVQETVSLNRFWAILYPLRNQMTKKHAVVVIVIIWVVCILLTVPYVMVLSLDNTTMACNEYWPGTNYRKAYTASLFALQYVFAFICDHVGVSENWTRIKDLCKRKERFIGECRFIQCTPKRGSQSGAHAHRCHSSVRHLCPTQQRHVALVGFWRWRQLRPLLGHGCLY